MAHTAKKQKTLISIALLTTTMTSFLDTINGLHIISSIPATFTKNNNVKLIGTHDGTFHCDEALAIGMLTLLPNYSSSDLYVLRTRKPELLEQCDIVVDVGAEYNPDKHHYDHHQRSFNDCLDGFNTKLSSAGLVFKHFGKDVIRSVFNNNDISNNNDFINICYNKIYKDFMEHIDAIDNGITICNDEPKYHISTSLSSRVGKLNPNWNEIQTSEVMNEQFRKAILLTSNEFISHTEDLIKSWWPARSIVEKSLKNRYNDSSDKLGRIIVFDKACPWKEHLFELEEEIIKEESNKYHPILYALYADSGGSWRIQAVPVNPTSFESRKKLPADWCGLRDNVLSEKCGINGCIFIHASGFIGGHATKEGAMEMALKALEIN